MNVVTFLWVYFWGLTHFYDSCRKLRLEHNVFGYLDQNTAGVHNESVHDDAGSYDSEIYDDVSFNIDQAFDHDESADEDYRLNEQFLQDYVTMSKYNITSHITQWIIN